MKKNQIFKVVLVIALCAALLLPFVPMKAEAKDVNNFDITCFQGKTISIIGDSISAYYGVSNSKLYNANIGSNATYYGNTGSTDYAKVSHITWADTWWQQAIDALGMELCVNNAWSGSKVFTSSSTTSDGWTDQITGNLSNVSGDKPDIIAVYLGTNDCTGLTSTSGLGTVANAKTMTATSTPTNALTAYSVMLQKLKKNYPNAEIYCFTLLHQKGYEVDARTTVYDFFNDAVKQLAAHYGCKVVDLYNASGVHESRTSRDYFLVDNVHPDVLGMDAITNCFISSLLKNSQYASGVAKNAVTYDLNTAYVEVGNVIDGEVFAGDVTTVVSGKPFRVKLDTVGISSLDIQVTMGGTDVTDFAVQGNVIDIASVTGDIRITAKDGTNNYYWVNGTTGFTSNPNQSREFTHNGVAKIYGTHTNGVYGVDTATGNAAYKLSQAVVLEHDRPWVMEIRMGGSKYYGGILLASDTETSNDYGTYIHLNQNYFYLGYHNNISYCNSGIHWTDIATKLGSTAGADIRQEMLTFKIVNVLKADGTNMPQLYVNGTLIGDLNMSISNDANLSGKDFVFNYLGTTTFPLRDCKLEYIKVWENGPVAEDEVHNFRWDGIGQGMTSVPTDGFFTANTVEQEMGTGANGTNEENSYYSLRQPINLYHDRAWTLEFRAKGNWGAGTGEDPMLLSSCNDYAKQGATYLWRNSSGFIAFGTQYDGQGGYHNYGYDVTYLGLHNSQYYTYRLENRLNDDGSNMVWLSIDGEELGALNQYRVNGGNDADPIVTDNWISGKDFSFNFFGNYQYPINGVTFDYIQVWEDGGNVNTTRLEYLINTAKGDSGAYVNTQGYTNGTWSAYVNALNAGSGVLSSKDVNQTEVNAAVEAILAARNALVTEETGTTIHTVEPVIGHAEIVSGETVIISDSVVGMQTGLRVITSPDVNSLSVAGQELVICTGEVQTMVLDGNETQVKVWLISWLRSATTETTENCTITASGASGSASTTVRVAYSDNYVTGAQLVTAPNKTAYQVDEKFDPTGAVMELTYKNGDTATVTCTGLYEAQLVYTTAGGESTTGTVTVTYDSRKLSAADTFLLLHYDGATVQIPVTVTAE